MPDIDLKCPKCSAVISVSEFVDAGQINCPGCTTKLKKPESASVRRPPTVRRQRHEDDEGPMTAMAVQPPTTIVTPTTVTPTTSSTGHTPVMAVVRRRYASKKFRQHFISWGLFFGVGGLMFYLRWWPGHSSPAFCDTSRTYGSIILIALHILIVLKAFRDSVFQGIMALLIPMYSVYYLFAVSDDFVMRALVGALAIGVGYDGFASLQIEILFIIRRVHQWISSGG